MVLLIKSVFVFVSIITFRTVCLAQVITPVSSEIRLRILVGRGSEYTKMWQNTLFRPKPTDGMRIDGSAPRSNSAWTMCMRSKRAARWSGV